MRTAKNYSGQFAAVVAIACAATMSARPETGQSSCPESMARSAVCAAANTGAARYLQRERLDAALVVQNVATGGIVAFAARSMSPAPASRLDVTSSILPLSVSKVLLAASFWEHASRIPPAVRRRLGVHEMLVGGSDESGREVARVLRRSVGGTTVIADLQRFGFPAVSSAASSNSVDTGFWRPSMLSASTLPPPAAAAVALRPDAPDDEWTSALSVGEHGFRVTLLHLSRFLQAVGADGVLRMPFVFPAGDPDSPGLDETGRRIMERSTARRIRLALLEAVERGTGRDIRNSLRHGWRIGGKTGTGPADAHPYDGCFAGLVFDSAGAARYTVVVYVRGQGRGGGVAARLAASVAAYFVEE